MRPYTVKTSPSGKSFTVVSPMGFVIKRFGSNGEVAAETLAAELTTNHGPVVASTHLATEPEQA